MSESTDNDAATRMRQLMQLVNLDSHFADVCARLELLLRKWNETGNRPPESGVLSGGEWRALALAARHPLENPLGDFLLLEDPLQLWVLEKLGLTDLWKISAP